MENVYYSLKDFELSLKKSAIERADDFQQYINQLNEFGCKSYWITSQTGVGSTMTIEALADLSLHLSPMTIWECHNERKPNRLE